jgi:hypothetical protein
MSVFDIHAIAGRFPPSADTMLVDTRLTDEKEASCRVFRIYVDVPTHYHATCDEYLLVVAGRGLFKIGDGEWFEARVGQLSSSRKPPITRSDCWTISPWCSWPSTPRGAIRRTSSS